MLLSLNVFDFSCPTFTLPKLYVSGLITKLPGTGVAVGVGVGVLLGFGVFVGFGVFLGFGVFEGVGVFVAVAVAVGVAVFVAVAVAVCVAVAVAVWVAVAVAVGVAVAVAVGVAVAVAVAIGVAVVVAVGVGVGGTTPSNSNAPMSQALPSAGRGAPRWSVAGQSASGIASIAKLGESSVMVSVGPPFFARLEARFRLTSVTLSPIVSPLAAVLLPKPQEASSEILNPPLVIVLEQLPPGLIANMLLVTVTPVSVLVAIARRRRLRLPPSCRRRCCW